MELLIPLVAVAALLTGCFDPSLDGKFECAADRSCPSGLRCAADGVCRGTLDAGVGLMTDAAICRKKTCAAGECGDALDGCGGEISCGMCAGAPLKTCGAGGANVCGMGRCMPRSCQDQGARCGLVSDGCAKVLSCGSCPDGESCRSDHQCG